LDDLCIKEAEELGNYEPEPSSVLGKIEEEKTSEYVSGVIQYVSNSVINSKLCSNSEQEIENTKLRTEHSIYD